MYFLLRMPDWIFAVLFAAAFPIYKALHKGRAYGRTVQHLQKAKAYVKSQGHKNAEALANCTAKEVFHGIYWNAINSYRGLARLNQVNGKIVFENEEIILNAIANSKAPDGTPKPIAAISIHQGAFELLHRSLCKYSDNVHLITDSVGDPDFRQVLKDLRSDRNLTEYHPDELPSLLRNLFDSPTKFGKKGNAILAMVVDQGRNTKGTKVSLFGQPSTLYLRLPEKINQMGAGIVTFRTFTRYTQNNLRRKAETVIRFETFYPAKFNERICSNSLNKDCRMNLANCIAKEIETWISEHPSEWSWNYHGNFQILG